MKSVTNVTVAFHLSTTVAAATSHCHGNWGIYLPQVNPYEIHVESMEWMLAGTTANSLFHGHHGLHVEWSWNGHGMVHSIWNPSLFHMDSTGFHVEFRHIHHGIHGTNPDGINDYHICSVLTILSKIKFTLSRNRTISHPSKTNTQAHWATTALL